MAIGGRRESVNIVEPLVDLAVPRDWNEDVEALRDHEGRGGARLEEVWQLRSCDEHVGDREDRLDVTKRGDQSITITRHPSPV